MLIIFSPTKTMNLPADTESYGSHPRLIKESNQLITQLKKLNAQQVGKLMTMSQSIIENTHRQYQDLSTKPSPDILSSAVLTYSGEAYKAMSAQSWNKSVRTYADQHLCILSGLYGMLKPSDLIQTYRLEMAAKTQNVLNQSLYQYWSDTLTQEINKQLNDHKNPVLINLASLEYRKVITKQLNHKVVDIAFKEERNGKLKVISFNAKRARGMMTHFILSNRIDSVDGIKKFDLDDYILHESSNTHSLLFVK